MSISTSHSEQLAIPIATTEGKSVESNIQSVGYYYDHKQAGNTNCKLSRKNNIYLNLHNADDDDDNSHNIRPSMFAKISGVVIAPQFNGKQVEILSYNESDETWTVQFEHYNNEMQKYLNIREEFLILFNQRSNKKACSNHNRFKRSNHKQHKQLIRLQTCGYYVLLALIVISCTCLLLTPFWSFSSLIFGRNDGWIFYLSYTFFCGLMCLIIWSKKINLRATNIINECRHCSFESMICYVFYMFCCILLWGMASYFGGFFFIYLWYCSQEIDPTHKRCNYFDIFMNHSSLHDDEDIIKRSICVYYYCLNNFESNMHKVYKLFIWNAYLTYDKETNITNRNIFYTKHWFANLNLSHNLPFIAGIVGYHFMIWFAVFSLNISDWSFLITVCNDILLLLCLFTAFCVNFVYYNKCRKQINLLMLTYFNLENIKKEDIAIINNEVENIYQELNQRIKSVEIIKQLLPIESINDIIVEYVYL